MDQTWRERLGATTALITAIACVSVVQAEEQSPVTARPDQSAATAASSGRQPAESVERGDASADGLPGDSGVASSVASDDARGAPDAGLAETAPLAGATEESQAGKNALVMPDIGDEEFAALSKLSLDELLAVPLWSVTTASKREEESGSAPATVFVVTKEDIYLRGYATLRDVLHDLPGMEIADYVYAPIGTQVAVRGVVGNNKIIVLVNGTRVNPPGGDPLEIRSDFSVREAEQIEVIYGPGSTLYGQDAISAVINVKTRRTTNEQWVDVGAGVGAPWRYDTWLGLNRKIGETSVNGYVQYSDANLTNREKEFPKEWETYKSNYLLVPNGVEVMKNPKRWDRGFNAFLQLVHNGASMQFWHRQSWRSSAEGRAGIVPFIKENQWSDVSTVIEAKDVVTLATDVTLTSALTFNRYEILPLSRLIAPFGTFWGAGHKYSLETGATLEETVAAKVGERLSLVSGFVFGHYDVMPMGGIPNNFDPSSDAVAQAGSIVYYTRPFDPSSKVTINNLSNPVYQNYGLYAEGTVKLHDRVRVLLGGRLDKDTRYGEVPLSPRGALVVNATSDLTLKAIYTQAFVAPAPYNMYDVYTSYWINTVNLGLKPERARSYELNAVYRRTNFFANVSGFYNIQKNLLLAGGAIADASLVSSNVYYTPNTFYSTSLYHDANGGTNRAYGVDVFGRYSLLSNRLSVWGSYSYVDSEMSNTVDRKKKKTGLPGLAHHNFRFGTSVNIVDKLFLTVTMWLRSSPENVSYEPTFSTVGTTLKPKAQWPYETSLHLIYRWRYGLEGFATIQNISDHHYATIYDGTAYPGETMRSLVGLRFKN